MWWKIILMIMILASIGSYWDEKYVKSRKRYGDRRKRRLYKFLMGLTYLITAGVSWLLVETWESIFIFYTVFGIIFAIGSFLAAINSNLRQIYSFTLFIGFIIWVISPYFNNHKIIFSIIDIYLIIALLGSAIENIQNMYNGIDPDIIEEEKEERKKWKRRFKLVKCLVKLWF